MLHVLLVCTANMCRSPMAEGILNTVAEGASVSSAGTHALGSGAAPDAVSVLAERGIDISGHVPRQVSRELLSTDGADLVVCMERDHVRSVVALDPAAWPRTLTLKELLRRSEPVGRRRTSEPLAAWLTRVNAGRRPSDLMGSGVSDDVTDPIGRGLERFRQTADELESFLGRTAALGRL